jgi:hypothetical protein
MDDRLRGSS